jgi:hypothetical protein
MVGNGRYGGFDVLVLEDSVARLGGEEHRADNSKKQVQKIVKKIVMQATLVCGMRVQAVICSS